MAREQKEIKKEENLIKVETVKTSLRKVAFIEEIKSGLGEEIKTNPNAVEFIVPPKDNKFKSLIKKLFKIF